MDQRAGSGNAEFRLVKDLELSVSLLPVEDQGAQAASRLRSKSGEPVSKVSHYILAVAVIAALTETHACDLCHCETPRVEASPQLPLESAPVQPAAPSQNWSSRFYVSVAEQFTEFNTLQFEGDEVANPTGQHLESSITQLVVGYHLTNRFVLQINVPLIYRSFERPQGFAIDRGTESGLGDVSLVADAVVLLREWGRRPSLDFTDSKGSQLEPHETDLALAVSLLGGVKFPTGKTDRLREEFSEIEVPGAPESGIHGHDLTLGTGSFDGIFGAQIAVRYRRFFFETVAFFDLRSEGAHRYEYADDVTLFGGPGVHFVRRQHRQLSLQFLISGEHKGRDRFRGEVAEDTGNTSVFLGPRILISFGRVSAELGGEIPVSIYNSALQVVPNYRLRARFALQF